MDIYTIGHSTHTQDQFIEMLRFARIEVLIDVRAFPGSIKFPQFLKENMKQWLKDANIEYHHIPKLGEDDESQI